MNRYYIGDRLLSLGLGVPRNIWVILPRLPAWLIAIDPTGIFLIDSQESSRRLIEFATEGRRRQRLMHRVTAAEL
jgi:hypothetical protein